MTAATRLRDWFASLLARLRGRGRQESEPAPDRLRPAPVRRSPKPEVTPPPTGPDDLYVPPVGSRITLAVDGKPRAFEVAEHLGAEHGLAFRARIAQSAGRGMRWDLRRVHVGSVAMWGRVALRVIGRTGRTLKLQVVAFVAPERPDEPSEENEGTNDGKDE